MSSLTLSGQTKTHWYPLAWATMANPTPVLPLVGSTIVPPGLSLPSRSAASIILTAIRSFTDPPGLRYSTLASINGFAPPVTRDSLSSGVLPTRSISDSTYCTARLYVGRVAENPATSPHKLARAVVS